MGGRETFTVAGNIVTTKIHLPNPRFLQSIGISLGSVVELSEVLQKVLQRACGVLSYQLHTEAAGSVDLSDVHSHHLVGRDGLLGVGGGHCSRRPRRLGGEEVSQWVRRE